MIEIFNDEEFKNLSVEEQKSVGLNYFNQEIADEEFNSLSDEEKQNIYNNFLRDEIGITEEKPMQEPTSIYSDIDASYDIDKAKLEELKNQSGEQDFYDRMLNRLETQKKEAYLKRDKEHLQSIQTQKKIQEEQAVKDANPISSFFSGIVDKYKDTLSQYQGEQITEEAMQQNKLAVLGSKRPALGLLQIVENTYNWLSKDDMKIVSKAIEDNEETINKFIKENNIDVNAINGADVGEFLIMSMPLSRAAGLIRGGFEAGAIAGLSEYGSGKTAGESLLKGAETTATTIVGGKILEKVVIDPLINWSSGISKGARLLGQKLGLSEDDILDIVGNVPKDQQALKLAESQGADALGNYKQAIRNSDELRLKLTKNIEERKKQVEKASGKENLEEVKTIAKDAWDEMESAVDKSGIVIDASSLVKSTDDFVSFAGAEDRAIKQIEGFGNRLKANPEQPLSSLLTMRRQINDQLTKSKGKPSFEYYNDLKNRLDNMIDNNVPKEYEDIIRSTQDVYSQYANQRNLNDILSKVTSKEEVTGHTRTAIDYNKALQLIEEEGLKGTVVEQTVETLKVLDKKFNTDYAVISKAKPQGVNPEEGALGVKSKIVALIKTTLWKVGEYGDNIAIQNAIRKGIENSENSFDALNNLIKSKDIPKDLKEQLVNNVRNIENLSNAETNKVKAMESYLGMSSSYGGKVTKAKQGTASYTDVSDSLFGTKTKTEVDRSGNLGMTSEYGGKATGTGGVNSKTATESLNEFMYDIANPKVEINKEYVSKMKNILDEESKLAYGFNKDKKEAFNKLRIIISNLNSMDTRMKASGINKVKKALEDYLKFTK